MQQARNESLMVNKMLLPAADLERLFDVAKPLMQSLLVLSLGFWLQWG
jgi:hypothetical protein